MASEISKSDVIINPPVEESNERKSSKEEEDDLLCEDDSSEDGSLDNNEVSDSEDYVPPVIADSQSDDNVSSGEEELGVISEQVLGIGDAKLYRLKFEDLEQKRKTENKENDTEISSDGECEEESLNEKTEKTGIDSNKHGSKSFSDYRSILDDDMETYKSDEDEDYNPMNNLETLSDEEYKEDDERDTESEPEIDDLDEKHKKTGETLKCIRMIEKLDIPPVDDSPAYSSSSQTPMDCA